MSRFWLILNSEEPLRSLLSFLNIGLFNCNLLMMEGGGPVGDDTLSYKEKSLNFSLSCGWVLTDKIYSIK